MDGIAIVETHPVQYHAPVYRCAAQQWGVPLHLVYGSDFSIAGYKDKEFGASFAWDTDLLSGVPHQFIDRAARDYDAVSAKGLSTALNDLAPPAVMALGYTHVLDKAAIAWAKHARVPLLFRGETSDIAVRRSWVKRLLRDFKLRSLYRSCAAMLYLGTQSRRHYQRLGVPDDKLFFSPYCVDDSTFQCAASHRSELRKATRERYGIANDATVILFSGKLSERKGVDLIPGAARKLKQKTHLLFLGDGALRASLEADCASEPAVSATFAGFQNQSALSAFYHAADLLVLPSRSMETWGLVVNEAMLHGLPSVVSDTVGCGLDLVLPGKTGAIAKADDVTDLTRAIEETLGLGDTSEACRETVAAYSVQRAAQGINEAWRSIS